MTDNNLPVLKEYIVCWEIELHAISPEEAAREALKIQRDLGSSALVFKTCDLKTGETEAVDLYDEEFGDDEHA